MAYWLKSVYNTDRRTSAADWRDQLTWLSDGHRFSGDRPTYRPKYEVGDELVVYAVTDGVCPVRAEVIAEPVFDPERVSRESGSDEGERWGWLTEIRVLAAADLDRAPSLIEVGVAPLSVRQSDHIHLTDEQYELARRELPAGSRRRRRLARPVPVEERHTESFEQRFEQRLRSVQREEQRMVRNYKSFLERRGRHVSRHLIALADGSGPLYTDLYEHDRGNLIEAKARIDRAAIRMAIGQLADYTRHIDPAPTRRAVLLPERPSKDLENLLASQRISVVWPASRGYSDNARGILT